MVYPKHQRTIRLDICALGDYQEFPRVCAIALYNVPTLSCVYHSSIYRPHPLVCAPYITVSMAA